VTLPHYIAAEAERARAWGEAAMAKTSSASGEGTDQIASALREIAAAFRDIGAAYREGSVHLQNLMSRSFDSGPEQGAGTETTPATKGRGDGGETPP
jgi:hypothetical protein